MSTPPPYNPISTSIQSEGQNATIVASDPERKGVVQDLEKLVQWHEKGVLNDQEFKAAKRKLIFDDNLASEVNADAKPLAPSTITPSDPMPAPKDIKLNLYIPPMPKTPTLVGVYPNVDERIIISYGTQSEIGLPPQIRDRGVSQDQWDEMMKELDAVFCKACRWPCFWIYCFMHMLCFGLLFITCAWLLYALCPYGWCFDCYTRYQKLWLKKWNGIMRPKGIYIKFQTIKRDFHEKKYICIAYSEQEIQKLIAEPIFQRGEDVCLVICFCFRF